MGLGIEKKVVAGEQDICFALGRGEGSLYLFRRIVKFFPVLQVF